MKIKYFTFLLCLTIFSACNYLDFDETSGLRTEENVYSYFNTTKQALTTVYSFLPQDFGVIGGAMRDAASDDAEYGASGAAIQDFNTGNWSPTNTPDNAWNLYNGVRAANAFMVQLETVDFSNYEYTVNYKKWMKQLDTFNAEARVLRATYFFELARRYGDIAMPLEVIDIEADRTISKTAFKDVIDFIVKECDESAQVLPTSFNSSDFDGEVGRVTQGYAYALKSRALLYAASELNNPTQDVEKWKKSVDAAWKLIGLNLYELDPAGVPNNSNSPEAVLMNRNGSSETFELNNFPIRFTQGSRTNLASANFPSQNLVDAFETINGYSVILTENGWESEDPDFDANNPYNNRDPRFYRTVLADGMSFKGTTIDLKKGGADDIAVTEGGSPTGYFLQKYIIEGTSFVPGNIATFRHSWVIYRYAETLLTYAESMIYAFKNPNYTDATYTLSALEALNMVRANAGMPAKETNDMNEFITMLRNERRVEFAFEDHRFWDIRRWKIGGDTQRELDGVRIREINGEKTYSRFTYERRQWKQAMERYPIPQEKLFVNPNLLPQNEGW